METWQESTREWTERSGKKENRASKCSYRSRMRFPTDGSKTRNPDFVATMQAKNGLARVIQPKGHGHHDYKSYARWPPNG